MSGLEESPSVAEGSSFGMAMPVLLIVLLVFVFLTFGQKFTKSIMKSARSRGNAVLLFGQCGAGKTALFFRLRDKAEVQTVSSLKQSRDKFEVEDLPGLGPLDIVDCPGHQRMKGKSASLIPDARCIVYMIDSEDKLRLKDVAEHLYELMTNQDVLDLHTPILLAMNKTESATARTEKFILDEIDREIEIMRNSRGATLEGQDQADSYLGIDGQKFKIMEHAPCPVSTCRISVKKGTLEPLFDFLKQQFGA
eukprot:CAMPEP_0206443780 /NCGR_PEP_ID=MMETSP0324_2-20121206/14555_1 /ASSEMBLY_ACC=CAM_ASM_000836 /TAXON_ID=2866 /ORGANISM="Crypthecodinium cohnii, Strain Seligo" /LENGTH=250 /DNA_ID=CAMNT_0053911747 /DNA_START=47 /DNA_END=799 /DNA_ORIENTATION=-